MVIYILLWILAALTSGSICYFTGLYACWYFDIIFVIAIPFLKLVWFGLYCLGLEIFSLFIKNTEYVEKPKKIYTWLIRQTSYTVLKLFHARIKKTGPDFPKERFLVIQNHTSNFDPMPFLWLVKDQPLCCITKPENTKLPIAGPYLLKGGFIPIDRENDFNAVKSIVQASKNIRNNISSIYLCPEGTRNHHPEDGMLEWKPGGLKIAYKSKCPIVVSAMSNAHKIAKRFWFHHTNVYVDILEIIPYEKYKDMSTTELAEYCKSLIAKKLEERK